MRTPTASSIALSTAGAVATRVISPTPTEPFEPFGRGVSRTIVCMSKAVRMLGYLNVTQSLVLPYT